MKKSMNRADILYIFIKIIKILQFKLCLIQGGDDLDKILNMLVEEFRLKYSQVKNTVELIDSGNTIPFIARYRKEATGELNDTILRDLNERLIYLRNLESKREDIKRLIIEQNKYTEEIEKSLDAAKTLQELDDIYRPFRPKRRTRATIAKEKGLEPLAQLIISQEILHGTVEDLAKEYVLKDKGVDSIEEAINGAMDIIAEMVSDNAEFRKVIRDIFIRYGIIKSEAKIEEDSVYNMYYDFQQPILKLAKHRILAINRGEREDVLKIKIIVPEERVIEYLNSNILKAKDSAGRENIKGAIIDSYQRLIFPSIEREVRNILTEQAGEQAIKVFSTNLKNLLLQPPVKGNVVLGLDPAYRTGCKIAVVDETGKVVDTTVIYPTPPQNKVEEARKCIIDLIEKHDVDIISIGNGTASKESEIFIADLLKQVEKKVYYMVVSESGASVYSASKLAAEEFPEFDVSLRSAISIARRLQDPLAELVKIDPKSIGVGQYQHDINQKRLGESLGGVVETCVNTVGVDLNTASKSLLSHISGINNSIAKNIVEYRDQKGKFITRKELKKVKKLGDKAFEQCAGFLRIPEGENVLDNTSVHPESYSVAEELISLMGYDLEDVKDRKIGELNKRISEYGIENVSKKLGVGVPTLRDIIGELLKPGRDPRDELPKPSLLTDVLDIEDLKVGMELTGTVRNVVDFGAFVDIGVHQDGLVHIAELTDKFVKNPMDIVAVGDIVKVKILAVDVNRKRISLSMKGLN